MADFWERLGKKNWNQFFFRLWVLFTIPFVIAIIFIITEELLTPTGQTIARIKAPDGRIARFEVQDGTTPEQATRLAQQYFQNSAQKSAPTVPNTRKLVPVDINSIKLDAPQQQAPWLKYQQVEQPHAQQKIEKPAYEDVIKALRRADASGNTEDAILLAKIAKLLKETTPPNNGLPEGFVIRSTPQKMANPENVKLPEGFVLEKQPATASNIPTLPEGFVLEVAPQPQQQAVASTQPQAPLLTADNPLGKVERGMTIILLPDGQKVSFPDNATPEMKKAFKEKLAQKYGQPNAQQQPAPAIGKLVPVDIIRKFNFRRVAEQVYLPILFPLGALLAGLSIRWLFRGLYKN